MSVESELTLEEVAEIDALCDRYESEWREAVGLNSLGDFVDAAPPRLRGRLFTELLALDGQLRQQRQDESSWMSLTEMCPFDVALSDSIKRATSEPPGSVTVARRSLFACPTFAGLSPAASVALQDAFEEVEVAAGDPLMREGQDGEGLFVILRGQLDILKATERGGQDKIDQCGAGSVLGEMSLLTGQTCTASVVARSPVVALRLVHDQYQGLLAGFPELEIALSQLVSDRLGRREQDALCGRELGGYRLVRCISRGGMGVLYECHRVGGHGEALALKMLRHRFVHEPQAVENFQREATVLQRLRHPNIIAVHDSFVDYRTRFLVLELCDGTDLRNVLVEHGPMDEATVRAVLGQIVSGLAHAHGEGIIHLDIKPENVLLDRNGRIALADFGLCQILGQEDGNEFIKGTFAYMPPEQLAGEAVDQRGDWYALGCLVVELLTGERLFDARDPVGLMMRKRTQVPSGRWPDVDISDELREVLIGLLQPEAEKRTWNVKQLISWSAPVADWHVGPSHIG